MSDPQPIPRSVGGDGARNPLRWAAALAAAGIALRAFHYLRDPAVWHDEAALIVNALGKTYSELLGPLYYAEAGPPLFLWLEKAVADTLGNGTLSLRLPAFLASCASLLLTAWSARRALAPAAVPLCVLLVACSDRALWHACEAKPYAFDILAAAGLTAMFLATENLRPAVRCALFVPVAPVVIWLSFPGCFICGGVLTALLPAVFGDRRWGARAAYLLLAATVFTAFGFLAAGPIRAQRHDAMDQCWVNGFPPWERPAFVPVWAAVGTAEIADYAFRPIGAVLILPAAAGAFLMWRRGRAAPVLLLTVPTAAALAASFLGAYPYDGSRVTVFALPALALLSAEALADWTARARAANRFAAALLLVPLLAAAGLSAWRVAAPWPRSDTAGASAWVLAERRPADAVTSNHWEYQYYFRGLGPQYLPLGGNDPGPAPAFRLPDAPGEAGERLWVVATARHRAERLAVLDIFPPGRWRLLAEREFREVTVRLLQRTGDQGSRR